MKLFREERGMAMVTALLVTLVVLSLGLVAISLSDHNAELSSLDRKRVQAINAAEAGLNQYFSEMRTSTGTYTCDDIDVVMPNTPEVEFHVEIQLYSTWPPAAGSELACDPAVLDGVVPAGAVVTSTGTAVTASSPVSVSRTMQSEVRLTPLYGGFNKAIFSDTVLNLQNRLTVNGYQANDGDVYTNGNLSIANNTVIAGSAYAQGWADIAQGIVRENVWANGYVRLSSSIEVFGNVTSSTGSISLSNAHVYGDAKAGTTITVGPSSRIDGTQTPNSPSGPPPRQSLPRYVWNADTQCAWTCSPTGRPAGAGYTLVSFSSCAAAKSWIDTMPVGNYVVRVTPVCSLLWGNNSTINIRGNLAIITDGSITTQNRTNWNAVGGNHTVFFIVPYRDALNCTKPSPYDISVSNLTRFNGLNVFVYSPCNVDFGNNNAGGVNGQIIGRTVTITNQMTMNYVPILVPAFNVTGYNVEIAYLREVRNPGS